MTANGELKALPAIVENGIIRPTCSGPNLGRTRGIEYRAAAISSMRTCTASISGLILALFVGSGCTPAHSSHFIGTSVRDANMTPSSPIGVMRTIELRHARQGLVGFELREFGTLLVVYSRFSLDDGRPLQPSDKPESYLFLGSVFKDIDLDRFISADSNERLGFPHIFLMHGNISVERWIDRFDFRIKVDVRADDLGTTRLTGILESYTYVNWL